MEAPGVVVVVLRRDVADAQLGRGTDDVGEQGDDAQKLGSILRISAGRNLRTKLT
jgi:hypothetical protein